MQSHLALDFAKGEAGRSLLDDKTRDTSGIPPPLSTGHHQIQISLAAIRHPQFRAIEYITTTIFLQLCTTLQAGGVRARTRLAERKSAEQFPGGQTRHLPLTLLLSAIARQ